jgi:hypothetical protein
MAAATDDTSASVAQETAVQRRDRRLRKLLKRVVWVLWTLLITLILFEAAYRYQISDYYATELNLLNPTDDLEVEGPALLVMGDSFSATQESYVKQLRDSLPGYRILNSAVPGTCAIQASYMAPRRFRRFKPKVLVYQIYVGNDLLDVRPPYNWDTLSLTRNFYWRLTTEFRSLGYVNYKLGQFKGQRDMSNVDTLMKARKSFSPETYNPREKMLLQGEPKFIEQSVQLQDLRRMDFGYLLLKVTDVLKHCRTGECEAFVVVMPHCAQVSEDYLHRMQRIGAVFAEPHLMDAHDYPFYRQLRQQIVAPNIHYVNPLPALQRNEKTAPMYYFDDPHLSPAGQAVVAHELLDSIHKYVR